ncbi:hypothetical protein C0992_008103 [Termitomyces sp. T32_za158]|nr:hypothetical protein C0992_008103 [Termitomyces sp. T32_za158]
MEAQRPNPNEQKCPDFATEAFTGARAALQKANKGIDDATAIVMLIQAWNLTNRAECAVWDAQRHERDVQKAMGEEQEREKAALSKEMKRNKLKYLDIPMRPPPTLPVEIASKYATAKLQKGQYVELWYFTNAGLNHARMNDTTLDEDVIVAVAGRDGKVELVPGVATRGSKSVVADRFSTWDDFTIAVRRILPAMEAAGWTNQRIRMLANFWGRLQSHPLRLSLDPLDTDALLLYEDEQSIVDEMLLARARDAVYREDRRKKDRERDRERDNLLERVATLEARESARLNASTETSVRPGGPHTVGVKDTGMAEADPRRGVGRLELEGRQTDKAGVFTAAQERRWLSAPCVSGATRTGSSSAKPGTTRFKRSPSESTGDLLCATAGKSAATGSAYRGADKPTTSATSAQGAGLRLTELRRALEHRELAEACPSAPEVWERELREAGLLRSTPISRGGSVADIPP